MRRFGADHWSSIAVIALALLLWAPRFSGPIDLRWDAGVYYLLGTSLAKGEGYRIASEPGSPEALQYPPLLPALVALHQWALGTTDPAIVAPWLRSSYVALFVIYSLIVLALAKRHLSPGFALAATALCMLHIMTIFLSDLLFAELPFAVVSVLFALVAASRVPTSRPWAREMASFALAAHRVSSTHNRCGAVSCLGDGRGHAAPMAVCSRAWGARVGAHHAMAGTRRASARE